MRTAYRALARRLHPDRMGDATPAERSLADRRMREINESWEVLRDPARRRAYDQSRTAPQRSARGPTRAAQVVASASEPDDLVDVLPPMTAAAAGLFRHLPWVVLVIVFGVIFLFTAYAGTHAEGTDPVPRATSGTCVDVDSGPVTTIVSCTGSHELKIVVRVDEATACPAGTERRRLGTDGLLDCVVRG